MTGRERLLKCFKCEPVDRIPVAPFIYNNFIKEFYRDPNTDTISGAIEVCKHFGFDIMVRTASAYFDLGILSSPQWVVKNTHQVEGDSTISTTIIRTPEKELRQITRTQQLSPYHQVSAHTEWYIKDEDDFKQFEKYMPEIPELNMSEVKRAKELVGEDGIVCPYVEGVFNLVQVFRKLDDLLADPYEDEEFYDRMMSFFLKKNMQYLSKVLDEGIDAFSLGGNIANGTITGPNFFDKFIFKYEKELIDMIQSRGTHVMYHNCGDARNMVEIYNRLEIHAFETMTEPPYADNNLKDCIQRFNSNVALHGNVDQITFLRTATPEEVRDKVKEKLEIVDGRPGFILGTSDFLEENTPHENLFAFAKAAREFGSKSDKA